MTSLTVRFLYMLQTHSTGGEPGRVHRGHGRRLAQLPSRFPVGLQGGGDRRVLDEPDHDVPGLFRPDRLGVRSQVTVRTTRQTGGHQSRRRQPARSTRNDGTGL